MTCKRSSRVRGISYIIIAFLFGYQLRATYDFNTNVQVITGTEEATNILIEYQNDQLLQLKNSSSNHQPPPPIHPKIAPRPSFSNENPTKCERQWDWPFLDAWEQETTDTDSLLNVTTFRVARSNAHETARGSIEMKVIQRKNEHGEDSTPRRVVILVSHQDTMGSNAWHRIAVQYMVWIAWQVAEHRLSDVWSTITHVELAMPCAQLDDIPQGWNDLLFTKSNNIDNDDDTVALVDTTLWCANGFSPHSLESQVEGLQAMRDERNGNNSSHIDVIVGPPNDGLLWDLAWDSTFSCKESHMFRTFMSQFARWQKTTTTSRASVRAESTETQVANDAPVVCWILRYGNPQRDISNRDEVHGMLLSIFDTVRLLHITRYHSSRQIANIMDDCEVFYGVHGAGMVNAMWVTMSSIKRTAVVEILPHNQPQYFRSLSRLVGHHYEGVVAENRMDDHQYYIDLGNSAEALRRALNSVIESI